VQSITSPWQDAFDRFVGSIQESAIIVAPFITRAPIERLAEGLRARNAIRLDVLTNLSGQSLCEGSVDGAALAWLCDQVPKTAVRHLRNLHAKAYVADDHTAIVTSANLTRGGIWRNYELGVAITDTRAVKEIADDLREYGNFGIPIPTDALIELDGMAHRARQAKSTADSATADDANSEYSNALNSISGRLTELSTSSDEFKINPDATITGKFGEAVKYLLRRHGALPTREIYPLVQDLMPEWCDDNVKRVVRGVELDTKWRHDILNAQQVLRRQGVIIREGDIWRLV